MGTFVLETKHLVPPANDQGSHPTLQPENALRPLGALVSGLLNHSGIRTAMGCQCSHLPSYLFQWWLYKKKFDHF